MTTYQIWYRHKDYPSVAWQPTDTEAWYSEKARAFQVCDTLNETHAAMNSRREYKVFGIREAKR